MQARQCAGTGEPSSVRRVRDDEVERWCACPRTPGEPGFDAWLEQEESWVAEHHPTARNLFVYEEGTAFLGKYDVPTEAQGRWRLWAPSVRDIGPEAGAVVMRALCGHIRDESRRRGVHDVQVIQEGGHAHVVVARQAMEACGFVRAQERLLVRRILDDTLPRPPRQDLVSHDCAELGSRELERLCLAAGMEAADAAIYPQQFARNAGSLLLKESGEPVGLALCASRAGAETLHLAHMGVVPCARERGVGKTLLLSVLRRARSLGSRTYIGSTARDNLAMQGVFAWAGCEPFAERLVYALPLQRPEDPM